MLSGSVAMGFYTIPRMTRDVDIVIEMNVGEVETFGIFTFTNPAYWKRRSGKGCST